MVYETDRSCHASSTSTQEGWTASIVSWFSRRHENSVKKIRLLKLLSYNDDTLDDIGLSRSKIINDLGYDPCKAHHIYAAFTFPNPFLSNGLAITKNHMNSNNNAVTIKKDEYHA